MVSSLSPINTIMLYDGGLLSLLSILTRIRISLNIVYRAGNRAGRAGLGRVNSGLGQNRARQKLARIFWTKILAAQPALKTGLVGPNSLLKAKKIQVGRAGPY